MIYSRDVLEDIKSKISILDLAAKLGINIYKLGNAYQANCKHEGDDTPSLTFYPETNTFHCFGCHKSGDILRLVSWYLDIPFPNAIEKIIEIYSLPVAGYTTRQRDILVTSSKLLVQNRDYWKELYANQEALDYLTSRSIDDEDIKKWRIGLVPPSRTTYAGRLVFAIMNERSETIGFAYKALNGAKPKYINSADSDIFKKSYILYGLNYIKDTIKSKGYVVLVEGYTDVIQLQKYGVPAVGLMGTALSRQQIALIKSLTNNVVTFLDPDIAGFSATERIIPLLKAEGLMVKLVVGHDKDPDAMAIDLRGDIIAYIEDKSVLLESYKIQSAIAEHKMKLDEINIKFLNKVFPLLSSINNAVDLEYQISVVASSCSIDENIIYRMLTRGGYYEQGTDRN